MTPANRKLSKAMFEGIFYTVPLGLFILDNKSKIIAWNNWMENITNISESDAIDSTINTLFPDENFQRYEWALDQVLNYGHPQFMSQALNKYLIPCKLKDELGFDGLELMQQSVEIHPLKEVDALFALVVIEDVTMKSHQQNALLNMAKRFETESLFDQLTGVYNRKYISTWIAFEMRKALKTGKHISCNLIDLDHFKKINDTFGHKAGDEVLVSFANLVKSVLRDSDMFARYGGEEFVVFNVIKATDPPCMFAERIRKKLEETPKHGSQSIPVTCSIGVSVWPNKIFSGMVNAESLIDLADKALYHAKNNGRNQVCLYPPKSS